MGRRSNKKFGWDQHSGAVGVNRFISYDPSASRRIASETRHCDCDRIVRRGNGPEAKWSKSASDDQCRHKGKGDALPIRCTQSDRTKPFGGLDDGDTAEPRHRHGKMVRPDRFVVSERNHGQAEPENGYKLRA